MSAGPIRVLPVHGEPLQSLLYRTMCADGYYSATEWRYRRRVPALPADEWPDVSLWRMASALGIELPVLLRFTPVPSGRTLRRLAGTVIERSLVRDGAPNPCPECRRRGTVPDGGWTVDWTLRSFATCHVHGLALDGCPPVTAEGLEFDRWQARRLGLREDANPHWLDDVPLNVALRLAIGIGATLQEGWRPAITKMAAADYREALLIGFGALRTETDFVRTLDRLANRLPPHGHVAPWGLYGAPVMDDLRSSERRDAAPGVVNAIVAHMLKHVPRPKLPTWLPTPEHGVETVVALAKELNLHPVTLGKVVASYDPPRFHRDRAIAPPRVVRDLRRRLAEVGSLADVRSRFGLTRGQAKSVLEDNGVGPLVGSAERNVLYSVPDVEAFLRSLVAGSPRTHVLKGGVPLADAAKVTTRSLVEIVRLVREGRVSVTAWTSLRFDGIYVRPEDIAAALSAWPDDLLPVTDVAARLAVTPDVARALMVRGPLPFLTVRHPLTRSKVTVATEEDVSAFARRYVSLTVLREQFEGVSYSTGTIVMAEAGVPCAFAGGKRGSWFEREGVCAAVRAGRIVCRTRAVGNAVANTTGSQGSASSSPSLAANRVVSSVAKGGR